MSFFKNIFRFITIGMVLMYVPVSYGQEYAVPVLPVKSLFTLTADFDKPSDVVVGKNGRIYVLDGVNNRVKVFSSSGKYLSSFGGAGQGRGKLKAPLGIGIDAEGRIYVADSGNHRVQVFSPEGTYLSQFSTDTGRKGFKPSDPTDVVVNSSQQKCYVVDNDNHCVLIYDLVKQEILRVHGIMGMERKEFRFPFLADIDQDGNIYIVEVINTRIKVLDPEGAYLANIGRWGVEKGELYRPKGIAVDAQGRVYVSDSYLGVVQVFDKRGTFLSVVGDSQGTIMKFKSPTGLFVHKNRLYVVEMLADRVKVLALKR